MPELPRNASGKIVKPSLRSSYGSKDAGARRSPRSSGVGPDGAPITRTRFISGGKWLGSSHITAGGGGRGNTRRTASADVEVCE